MGGADGRAIQCRAPRGRLSIGQARQEAMALQQELNAACIGWPSVRSVLFGVKTA
jgi:hypothetical protein